MSAEALVAGAIVLVILVAVSARRRRSAAAPPLKKPLALTFESNESFFEYTCRYGKTDPREAEFILGIVEAEETDVATRMFPTEESLRFLYAPEPGSKALPQILRVRLASSGGSHIVRATTAGPGERIAVGDLVVWAPVSYHPTIGKWLGYIVAKAAPAIGPNGGFMMIARYIK